MELKDFWEKPAQSKWLESDLNKEMMDDLVEWFSGWEGSELEVLDVGSGAGRLFTKLSEVKANVDISMVDWSEYGRNMCLENTGYKPDKWDGLTLPYNDDSFDIVVLSNFLLHVRPRHLVQIVNEVLRVARQLVYFNLTTWDDAKYDGKSWCFSHNSVTEVLPGYATVLWDRRYTPKNPKFTISAFIVDITDATKEEVVEDDIQSQFGEDDGDSGELDSSSSDESTLPDDSEVGRDTLIP